MIIVVSLEASTAHQVTKAHLITILQSSVKLHTFINHKITTIKTIKFLPLSQKLSMLHALTQKVLVSCQKLLQLQLLQLMPLLMTILSKTHYFSTSQKEDGSAQSAKTTILKVETIATDAKKKNQMKITKESQNTWVKLNSPRSKRKLLKLKKRLLLNKANNLN